MKNRKFIFGLSLLVLGVTAITSCTDYSSLPPVIDLGNGGEEGVESFVNINEITNEVTTLYPGESIQLTGPENVTWSVSNSLATIDENGLLKAGETDGEFIVTATSKFDSSFTVNKAFKIYTMNTKDLANNLYKWAEGYNYTMDRTGRFLKEDGSEVTKADIIATDGEDAESVLVYEDFAEKGNQVKYMEEAFYVKYGVTGDGTTYEGGSYNSPLGGGSVWDYDIVDGKAVRGMPDYFDGYLGYGDYKAYYTSDLTFFMRDEFKVEDSNLTLKADKSALVYDALKDQNDFRNKSQYNTDYSIPITLWGIIDSTYALQFFDYAYDLSTKGEIVFDDHSLTGTFIFENVYLSAETYFDYEATFTIRDIGTTVIDGIAELIAQDAEEEAASEK